MRRSSEEHVIIIPPDEMAEVREPFCSPTNTENYVLAQKISKTFFVFGCAASLIGSVSSTMGNILILFALGKCQTIHPPSKALLCSLALTDLFVGLVVLPLFAAYYLMIILEIPSYYCVAAVTYGRASTFIAGVSLETITTIAIDRYFAFHLRMGYRELVKFRRVVYVLALEWILTASWSGSWFWNEQVNKISGAITLFVCCLVTSFCYISIYRGLRRHFVQIHDHQQNNSSERELDSNLVQYKKTVNNMLWIIGLLFVCYIPFLSTLLAILAVGLNDYTRFALHFSGIAIYLNSFLNPVIYCWKIKELRENVIAILRTLWRTCYHFVHNS